jgi:DNA-binding transcriptional ArsR family regulator
MIHTPLRDALTVAKALADEQRLRILMLLRNGELCVCQVVAVLKLANSTISKHLSILAAAGLVEARRDGRWSYYSLTPDGRGLRLLGRNVGEDPQVRGDEATLAKVRKQSLEVLCRQQRTN